MTRKFGILATLLVCCFGAAAAVNPGVIAGTVRDATGVPQMGASVQLLASSASRSQTVLTDAQGFYTIPGLLPGLYTVKVTAPSFLPTIRESLPLQSGANLLINVTLNTLYQAIQLVPRRKVGDDADDDWRWALRSVASRPILRLVDDDPLIVVHGESGTSPSRLKARVSWMAGSDGQPFHSSAIDTSVQIESAAKGNSTPTLWSLSAAMGVAPGDSGSDPDAVLRAAYSRQLSGGSTPEMAFTASRLAVLNPDQPAIQAMALSIANAITFGDAIELAYGNQTQVVQFKERAIRFHPCASLRAHPARNTILQYRYATSAPDSIASDAGTPSPSSSAPSIDPAESGESAPLLTLTPQGQRVEQAIHHEVSVSQRVGESKLQLALFSDSVQNTALTGTGATRDAFALIDPFSGTFAYNGGHFHTQGVRVVYAHPLAFGLDATFDYAYGGVLTAPENLVQLSQVDTLLITARRHAAAAKLCGTAARTHTRVVASYRWLSGSALTPVDRFNASAGETAPYLSFFLRQPVPAHYRLPHGLEALVEVRNLLAQGYRPVLSPDGNTVYLIQRARCIRAGLDFTF